MDNQSIANINSPVLVGATEDLYQVSWLRLNSRLEIFFFLQGERILEKDFNIWYQEIHVSCRDE